MPLFPSLRPPTLEVEIDDELKHRIDLLKKKSAPLDLRLTTLLKIGLDEMEGKAKLLRPPNPREELERNRNELDRLRQDLAEKRAELEEMRSRKARHEEDLSILEYYQWMTDMQVREMEDMVKGLDHEGEKS